MYSQSQQALLYQWWQWMTKTVDGLAALYGISLALLWLMDTSHNDLRMGWWFAPHILYFLVLLPASLTSSMTWVRMRAVVQFAFTLGALACNISFFIIRVVDFANNCGPGSSCDQQQTMFAAAAGLSLFQALIAAVLVWVLVRCPALHSAIALEQLARPPLAF
jgi:hypothetical protein